MGAYTREFGLHTVALRYFTVCGPRQRPDMAFHRVLRCLHTGASFTLLGDGEQERDWTYVGDAVRANLLAAERGQQGRVYNVGGGRPRSLRDAITVLEETVHRIVHFPHRAAVGTAGQRCTSLRRLFLQKGIADQMIDRLKSAYASVRIGDPMDENTLMGPLVNQRAIDDMMNALEAVKAQGGEVLYGGGTLDRPGFFVEPTLVKATSQMPITCDETFAPILYIFEYDDLDDAIEQHNSVPQGLSSAIFTLNMRSAERFLAATGSDCGIANVNIGTSGAEIGGAFGGEKETGGGREAGSDSWKIYMRRQTCTLNWGTELPLAQGVEFDL